MPTKRSPAAVQPNSADLARDIARDRLLDLTAKILARQWLRPKGNDVKAKVKGKK
jgi:hypothetical protein